MPPDWRTSSLSPPLLRMPFFGCLLCELLLIGGCLKAMVCFIFLFFCHSICHPKTIIRHPPHTFCRDCVSSIMIPSPLTPTFSWLLHLTSKQRPPKAKTPSSSLIFWWVGFWCPKQGNQPWRLQTRHQVLAVDPWGVMAPRFGGATALPMEREGKAAGG